MPKKTKKKPQSQQELAEIGQMLVSITESGYADKKAFYRMSFIKGVLAGFGGVLGATILVGLLLWILSFFDTVPFVQEIVNTIETQPK